MIDKEATIFDKCEIDPTAIINKGSLIGKLFRPFLDGDQEDFEITKIEKDVYVGYNCIIGTGSQITEGVMIDDKATIESRVKIGEKTLVIYSSHICNDVEIGNNCVIGGFVGERTKVGNQCRMFGQIVHNQLHPLKDWDDEGSMEAAVVIKDKVFIGFNSVVAGSITIGPRAYILAGSVITKDVPEGHIAYGINKVMHHTKWHGKLKESNLFFG